MQKESQSFRIPCLSLYLNHLQMQKDDTVKGSEGTTSHDDELLQRSDIFTSSQHVETSTTSLDMFR